MKNFRILSGLVAALAFAALAIPAQAQIATQFVNAQTGTSYTVLNSDCSKLVTLSNAAAVAVTLPQASTNGNFFPGCFVDFENKGVGTVTITPTTSTINGGSTLVLSTGQGTRIVADGTNYQVQLGAGTGGGSAPCTSSGATPQTCNGLRGVATTNSLSTAAATNAAYVINNSSVTATSVIQCSNNAYSGTIVTNGYPILMTCVPGAGTITVNITNTHPSNALSGTVAIGFQVLK